MWVRRRRQQKSEKPVEMSLQCRRRRKVIHNHLRFQPQQLNPQQQLKHHSTPTCLKSAKLKWMSRCLTSPMCLWRPMLDSLRMSRWLCMPSRATLCFQLLPPCMNHWIMNMDDGEFGFFWPFWSCCSFVWPTLLATDVACESNVPVKLRLWMMLTPDWIGWEIEMIDMMEKQKRLNDTVCSCWKPNMSVICFWVSAELRTSWQSWWSLSWDS